jgi:hypothetical protein
MDEVMKQAPDNISREEIEIIFKKNDENITDSLIDLWKLDVPKSTTEPKTATDKWANIREVCDSYDLEMQSHLKRMKQ